MKSFDKKIKKLSKEFQAPETYHKKIDVILGTIREDNILPPKRKPFFKVAITVATICVVIMGCLLFSGTEVSEAGFFEAFKQTIMDVFGIEEGGAQKIGVGSEKQGAVSKPELLIELQEVVMDSQNIYVVVKITAPPDVKFEKGMTFDYFGFCEGSNYNVSKLVPGTRSCELLEVMEGRENVALYVVSISTDQQIEEGKEVTAFFKDLLAGPYGENPSVLVEGMWGISFTSSYTVSEDITIEGTEDMEYSLLDTTAAIKEIKLLPLGLTIVSDVSNIPVDTLHTSNTEVCVRLKMISGEEIIVTDPESEEPGLTSGGSVTEYEEDRKVFNKYVYQFDRAIDIGQVLGIYIGDCYMLLKEYE